jgi:pimeloyl-ACP methyl ester carboxylesterase
MPTIVTRSNCSLHVKEQGAGRPVVLVHGWPLTADTWDELGMDLAASGMHAIAYDRRGFGRSEQPVGGYDYDTMADDLADVIAHFDARDATLIAFSMGGGEVARYLSRHGAERIRDTVLISSVVPYMLKTEDNPEGVDASVFQDMDRAIKADRATFWGGFFKDFYGVGKVGHSVSGEVLEWSRRMAMQAELYATLKCVEAFGTTDFRRDMSSFTMPTLIIHGKQDVTVPIGPTARKAVQALPQATLIEYEGAAHGIPASHKEQLSTDVLKFLRRA